MTRRYGFDTEFALAYNNRGIAYGNLGRYHRAILDYNDAIRLNPKDPVIYTNRALAYTLIGEDTRAQEDVGRAVELGFERSVLEREIQALKVQR